MPTVGPITIDISPVRKILSIHYIDFNGKTRTDSYTVPLTTTDAEMNTLVSAIGDGTNAAIGKVSITLEYGNAGGALASDAINAVDDSVYDNVVTLWKDAGGLNAFDLFIPAPIEAMIVDGTTNPDPTNTELAAIVAAAEPVFDSFVRAYRYTERRKKNRAVKA